MRPLPKPPKPPKREPVAIGAADPCGVIERWIGIAGPGAVGVGAGMLKVRVPRLPKLKPLPGRASAVATPSISTAAAAIRMLLQLGLVMAISQWRTLEQGAPVI
ncbi:MAG: hypothetical protein ACHQAY_09995 [Hyphomicrobiales bacterium]